MFLYRCLKVASESVFPDGATLPGGLFLCLISCQYLKLKEPQPHDTIMVTTDWVCVCVHVCVSVQASWRTTRARIHKRTHALFCAIDKRSRCSHAQQQQLVVIISPHVRPYAGSPAPTQGNCFCLPLKMFGTTFKRVTFRSSVVESLTHGEFVLFHPAASPAQIMFCDNGARLDCEKSSEGNWAWRRRRRWLIPGGDHYNFFFQVFWDG